MRNTQSENYVFSDLLTEMLVLRINQYFKAGEPSLKIVAKNNIKYKVIKCRL